MVTVKFISSLVKHQQLYDIVTAAEWQVRIICRCTLPQWPVQLADTSSLVHNIWLLSAGLRCGVKAALSFRQSTSSGRTASPSQHVRPPGFCCGWPRGLELSPGQSPGTRCYYRQLQALVENILFLFSAYQCNSN